MFNILLIILSELSFLLMYIEKEDNLKQRMFRVFLRLKRGFDSVRTLDSLFTHVLQLNIIATSLYPYCIFY